MSTAQNHTQILEQLIEKMSESAVLVIGDIMLDRFIYGYVERISPESPIPVLSIAREDYMLGGAGNALANLAGLGVKAHALSVIGDDEEGKTIAAQAETLGLDTSGLIIDETRPTTVKTRYLAGHQQLLRTDFEKKAEIDDKTAQTLIAKAKALIPAVTAIILSDYGKGLLRTDVLEAIIAEARARNVPVIVDPKGQDFSIYKGATALTPNKKELSDATKGKPVSSDEEIIIAAGEIIDTCAVTAVIATRSKDGISVIQKDTAPVHLQTADIEVFDVSGAGDTVIATIAATLAAGGTLVEAAALANIAGSVVVQKVGTAPIRRAELRDTLHSDQGDTQTNLKPQQSRIRDRSREADILGWDEAAEQIKRWKARGLKVGFTNGCFDILHFGHVSYLNQAREACDRLVMGLNSDSSVRILKGDDRPVHDENSRAAVLAALGSIDLVTVFGAKEAGDDNTAIALLETLKPDIYFKGGDYTIDQIPEAPTVQKHGGVVSVMPVYEGHSTTNSLAKINSSDTDDKAA